MNRPPRYLWTAYLLLVFLGTLGLHRFYLHRNGSALAMLLITVLTAGAGLIVTLPWCLVDLFLVPGITRQENAAAAQTAELQARQLAALPPLPPTGPVQP